MSDRIFNSPVSVKLLGSASIGDLLVQSQVSLSRGEARLYGSEIEERYFRRLPDILNGHSRRDAKASLHELFDYFLEHSPVLGNYYDFIVASGKAQPKDGEVNVGGMYECFRRKKLLQRCVPCSSFLLSTRVDRAMRALGDRAVEMELLTLSEVGHAVTGYADEDMEM